MSFCSLNSEEGSVELKTLSEGSVSSDSDQEGSVSSIHEEYNEDAEYWANYDAEYWANYDSDDDTVQTELTEHSFEDLLELYDQEQEVLRPAFILRNVRSAR
jgi:hypothetical protein